MPIACRRTDSSHTRRWAATGSAALQLRRSRSRGSRPLARGGDRTSRAAEPLAALERRRGLDARVQRHAAAVRRPDCLRAQASGRFFATPGLRGKPVGVGPVFLITMNPGWDWLDLARELPGHMRDRRVVGGRPDPEHRPRRPPHEWETPLRRHGRGRERLGDGDAEHVVRLAPRLGPRRRGGSAAPPSTVRGTRSCAAPLRAASPRAPAARPRAGSRACRRHCRRRRSGRRSAARARARRGRPRAGRAAPLADPSGLSARVSPARRRASARGGQMSTWRG